MRARWQGETPRPALPLRGLHRQHRWSPACHLAEHGSTVIAFVEDPDGYKTELIQKKSA